MAIRIPGDTVIAQALNFNPDDYSDGYKGGVYVVNKAIRLSMLAKSAAATSNKVPPNAYVSGSDKEHRDLIEAREGRDRTTGDNKEFRQEIERFKDDIEARKAIERPDTNQWSITIADLDYRAVDEEIGRPRSLDLYYMPREVSESPKSTFATLAPLGRNNPHYQFVGSEDMLQFEIDWHAHEQDKKDVIKRCRWIQSLTKADGWEDEPHRVHLIWSSNPIIWRDDIWILVSADTRYTQFTNGHRMNNSPKGWRHGTLREGNLLPVQAYQKLLFKKVTSYNLSIDRIGQFSQLKSRPAPVYTQNNPPPGVQFAPIPPK